MVFRVKADLVGLIRGLVAGMQAFAKAHEVQLVFQSPHRNLIADYQPEEVIPAVTQLISRITTFTPQSYTVQVSLEKDTSKEHIYLLKVCNTGVDLSRLREIYNGIKFKTTIKANAETGTCFQLEIPSTGQVEKQERTDHSTMVNSKMAPYYSKIRKRLTNHYKNVSNLEMAASQRSEKEGVFLKKVNAVINSHMEQNEFKAETLAKAMALSRTQLFRRIKILTALSPGKYIQFVRLQKAKQLLETKEWNVSEVAYQVGFVSNSHFTRAFQKQFGFNPSSYK